MQHTLLIALLATLTSLGLHAHAPYTYSADCHAKSSREGRTSSGVYGNVGTIGGFPTVGLGYRSHQNHWGLDVCGKVTPWHTVPAASGRALALYYPKERGFYLGAGAGFVREGEALPHGRPSVDAAIGYEWTTSSGRPLFVQLEGLAPLGKTPFTHVWPGVTFGMSF